MEIKRTSVLNEILKQLQANIVSGMWKPGDKIDTEISLSQQLNVSRASVHSAIQQMVALGILESHQGKGTFVRSIPILEIKNRLNTLTKSVSLRKIMEFRVMLEGEICKNIASDITDDTLHEMEKCLDAMARNLKNAVLFAHWDMQFHCVLANATHNEIIIQSLNIICDETERQNSFYATDETRESTLKYHKCVIDCLSVHDGESAKRFMIKHLQAAPCDPPFAPEADASFFSL